MPAFIITHSVEQPYEFQVWRGRGRDALHALDVFSVEQGFAPYSEIIDPRGSDLHESERDGFVSQDADGVLWAVFTNMNLAVVEVPAAQVDGEQRIVREMERGMLAWQRGECASPSERDHVMDAARVLGVHLTEQTIESLSDALYQQAGDALQTPDQVAQWLYYEIGPAPSRHLHYSLMVSLPEGDLRTEEEIKQTLLGVLEVGADDDAARDLTFTVSSIAGREVSA